ncbi:unnamed protein product [Amoebophrya sp. A120]|nr:unnamed protein product [Amoebophrya sp. A120]|eukprot:GSA120T00022157001.1
MAAKLSPGIIAILSSLELGSYHTNNNSYSPAPARPCTTTILVQALKAVRRQTRRTHSKNLSQTGRSRQHDTTSQAVQNKSKTILDTRPAHFSLLARSSREDSTRSTRGVEGNHDEQPLLRRARNPPAHEDATETVLGRNEIANDLKPTSFCAGGSCEGGIIAPEKPKQLHTYDEARGLLLDGATGRIIGKKREGSNQIVDVVNKNSMVVIGTIDPASGNIISAATGEVIGSRTGTIETLDSAAVSVASRNAGDGFPTTGNGAVQPQTRAAGDNKRNDQNLQQSAEKTTKLSQPLTTTTTKLPLVLPESEMGYGATAYSWLLGPNPTGRSVVHPSVDRRYPIMREDTLSLHACPLDVCVFFRVVGTSITPSTPEASLNKMSTAQEIKNLAAAGPFGWLGADRERQQMEVLDAASDLGDKTVQAKGCWYLSKRVEVGKSNKDSQPAGKQDDPDVAIDPARAAAAIDPARQNRDPATQRVLQADEYFIKHWDSGAFLDFAGIEETPPATVNSGGGEQEVSLAAAAVQRVPDFTFPDSLSAGSFTFVRPDGRSDSGNTAGTAPAITSTTLKVRPINLRKDGAAGSNYSIRDRFGNAACYPRVETWSMTSSLLSTTNNYDITDDQVQEQQEAIANGNNRNENPSANPAAALAQQIVNMYAQFKGVSCLAGVPFYLMSHRSHALIVDKDAMGGEVNEVALDPKKHRKPAKGKFVFLNAGPDLAGGDDSVQKMKNQNANRYSLKAVVADAYLQIKKNDLKQVHWSGSEEENEKIYGSPGLFHPPDTFYPDGLTWEIVGRGARGMASKVCIKATFANDFHGEGGGKKAVYLQDFVHGGDNEGPRNNWHTSDAFVNYCGSWEEWSLVPVEDDDGNIKDGTEGTSTGNNRKICQELELTTTTTTTTTTTVFSGTAVPQETGSVAVVVAAGRANSSNSSIMSWSTSDRVDLETTGRNPGRTSNSSSSAQSIASSSDRVIGDLQRGRSDRTVGVESSSQQGEVSDTGNANTTVKARLVPPCKELVNGTVRNGKNLNTTTNACHYNSTNKTDPPQQETRGDRQKATLFGLPLPFPIVVLVIIFIGLCCAFFTITCWLCGSSSCCSWGKKKAEEEALDAILAPLEKKYNNRRSQSGRDLSAKSKKPKRKKTLPPGGAGLAGGDQHPRTIGGTGTASDTSNTAGGGASDRSSKSSTLAASDRPPSTFIGARTPSPALDSEQIFGQTATLPGTTTTAKTKKKKSTSKESTSTPSVAIVSFGDQSNKTSSTAGNGDVGSKSIIIGGTVSSNNSNDQMKFYPSQVAVNNSAETSGSSATIVTKACNESHSGTTSGGSIKNANDKGSKELQEHHLQSSSLSSASFDYTEQQKLAMLQANQMPGLAGISNELVESAKFGAEDADHVDHIISGSQVEEQVRTSTSRGSLLSGERRVGANVPDFARQEKEEVVVVDQKKEEKLNIASFGGSGDASREEHF